MQLRVFAVLKKCFFPSSLVGYTQYLVDTRIEIVLACCNVYNYLMGVNPDEKQIAEVDNVLRNESHQQFTSTRLANNRGDSLLRDNIAVESGVTIC